MKNRHKSKKNEIEKQNSIEVEKSNSLTELALGLRTQQNQVGQSDTIDLNLRRYLLTNRRDLLSSMYIELGIVQTLIDQPVDDAYSELPKLIAPQLNNDDIAKVEQYIIENNWLEIFKQALKWGRLFGGAGLFVNTPQNPASELRIDLLKEGDKVSLYACDRWELNYSTSGKIDVEHLSGTTSDEKTPYNLYGQPIHKSRVLKIKGKEAPSLQRMQLMGWGMSEVERLVRSLNSYLKNQDVVFELLDEAKVDVYKIEGYNDLLTQPDGTTKVQKQVSLSNSIKNYLNALVMDSQDDYQQKNMSFAGLPEMNTQNKENIASDLRMPITKLFGISSAGFNSGEDDIENYNSMIKSEIRAKSKTHLITIYKLACAVTLGFVPEDIDIELPDLRILSAEQTEAVKNHKFQRLVTAFQNQLISEEDFKESCNKEGLLPIDLNVKESTVIQQEQEEKPTKKEKQNGLWGLFNGNR